MIESCPLNHISECGGPITKPLHLRWVQLLSTFMEFFHYLVAPTIDPLIYEGSDGDGDKTDGNKHGGHGICSPCQELSTYSC